MATFTSSPSFLRLTLPLLLLSVCPTISRRAQTSTSSTSTDSCGANALRRITSSLDLRRPQRSVVIESRIAGHFPASEAASSRGECKSPASKEANRRSGDGVREGVRSAMLVKRRAFRRGGLCVPLVPSAFFFCVDVEVVGHTLALVPARVVTKELIATMRQPW